MATSGVFLDKTGTKITAQELKNMEMHEMKALGRVHILRVWAGWIYYTFNGLKVESAVFVPEPSNLIGRDKYDEE